MRILFLLLFMMLLTQVTGCGEESILTPDDDDLVRFRVTSVSHNPARIVQQDTVRFRAVVTGNTNLITDYRWRIIDVTSNITRNQEFVWIANVPPGNYRGEVRPRSNANVTIQSYWFEFTVHPAP